MFCFQVFVVFECLHGATFKLSRLEFRCQILPFSNHAGKKMRRFASTEGPRLSVLYRFQIVSVSGKIERIYDWRGFHSPNKRKQCLQIGGLEQDASEAS